MKIRFSMLERLRRNPKSVNDKNVRFGGRSKFTRWQDSIGRYHSNGNNIPKAEQYLIESFGKFADNASNRRDLAKYIDHLYLYDQDYKKLSSEKLEFRANFTFDLVLDYTVGGQISRLDINTLEDGYSVYCFEKDNSEWKNELKFPLIQNYIADYFGCDNQVVNIGIYNLKEDKHLVTKFTKPEIQSAQEEIVYVINEIDKILKQ